MSKQNTEIVWKLFFAGIGIFVPMASGLLTYLVISVHKLEIAINDLSARTFTIRDSAHHDRDIAILKERGTSENREIEAIKSIQANHESRIQQLERGK